MSTAPTSAPQTPSPATPSPPRGAGSPQRVPVSAPPPGGGATMGFGNIDPIRLLRRYWMLLAAAAFVGAVLGAAGHFAMLKVSPMYTSAAIFECRPPVGDTRSTGTIQIQQADFDRFMGTQMQRMTSMEVLQKALNSPNLAATGWAKQFYSSGSFQTKRALPALQGKVSAKLINQTSLIRLSMTWRSKEDVQTVVESVANAYMQDLRAMENTQSADRRQVLSNQRDSINDQIRVLNRNRDQILRDGRVTNLREGADAAEQQQSKITQDLVEAQQQGAQMNSLLERLVSLKQANAVIPYPDDMVSEAKADPVIMSLTQQLTQLKVDEASLRAQGLGDEHPAVQATLKRIEATRAEMDSQMTVVLDRIYNSRVEELQKSVQSAQARQQKLEEELKLVSARKQDLLKLMLQVEQIESQTKELTDQLTEVARAQQEMENLSSNPVFDRVRLLSPAQIPNEVSFPKLAVMLPLGVLLLTGLTASVILLRELMDQRVKGPADVAMIPRLRVLGMVPDASEDPSRPGSVETAFRDTPGGVVTESFRQVRAPLVNKLDAEGLRTVLFLAGMPGSGGTTVAANLALACAGADDKVLLIDANFRRPALHRVMGIGETLGLADCLAGQTTLADAVRPASPNLAVLTAGSAGNRMLPERLGSESMARLLADAAARYDRVFIDAPPAIVSGDGLAIANRCDAVVMVVRAYSEKRGLVNRIRAQLANARAELVGVVVNGVKSSAGGYFKRNIQATHEYQNAAKA